MQRSRFGTQGIFSGIQCSAASFLGLFQFGSGIFYFADGSLDVGHIAFYIQIHFFHQAREGHYPKQLGFGLPVWLKKIGWVKIQVLDFVQIPTYGTLNFGQTCELKIGHQSATCFVGIPGKIQIDRAADFGKYLAFVAFRGIVHQFHAYRFFFTRKGFVSGLV